MLTQQAKDTPSEERRGVKCIIAPQETLVLLLQLEVLEVIVNIPCLNDDELNYFTQDTRQCKIIDAQSRQKRVTRRRKRKTKEKQQQQQLIHSTKRKLTNNETKRNCCCLQTTSQLTYILTHFDFILLVKPFSIYFYSFQLRVMTH